MSQRENEQEKNFLLPKPGNRTVENNLKLELKLECKINLEKMSFSPGLSSIRVQENFDKRDKKSTDNLPTSTLFPAKGYVK
jgi:hypothetical protein